jgi:hypothetical protein
MTKYEELKANYQHTERAAKTAGTEYGAAVADVLGVLGGAWQPLGCGAKSLLEVTSEPAPDGTTRGSARLNVGQGKRLDVRFVIHAVEGEAVLRIDGTDYPRPAVVGALGLAFERAIDSLRFVPPHLAG